MRALLPALLLLLACAAFAAPPAAPEKGAIAKRDASKTTEKAAKRDASKKAEKPAKPAKRDAGKKAARPDKADKAGKAAKRDAGKKSGKAAKRDAGKKKGKDGRNARMCDYQSPIHEHEIVPGEIAGAIAGRYGVTVDDLKRWNRRRVKSIDRIRPGQKLQVCPLIPPRERIHELYTVQKGDTFASIAKKFDLSQDELWDFQEHKLQDRAKLGAGRTVLVIWRDGEVLSDFLPEDERGSLKSATRLRTMPQHFYIKRKDRTYGTRKSVQLIQKVFERYRQRSKGPTVVMGDLSQKAGGPISGHVSHQDGRDVDIGWVYKKGKGHEKTFVKGTEDSIDVPRTWALIHEFLKTGEVQFIFVDHDIQALLYEEAKRKKVSANLLAQWFQYPRPAHRLYGIVRHWKGHDDHMHIRFRKGS